MADGRCGARPVQCTGAREDRKEQKGKKSSGAAVTRSLVMLDAPSFHVAAPSWIRAWRPKPRRARQPSRALPDRAIVLDSSFLHRVASENHSTCRSCSSSTPMESWTSFQKWQLRARCQPCKPVRRPRRRLSFLPRGRRGENYSLPLFSFFLHWPEDISDDYEATLQGRAGSDQADERHYAGRPAVLL